MFEVQHKPGISHHIPDGLSQRLHADDDSEHSGDDIDIEDRIKLAKALPVEFEFALTNDSDIKNGLWV